MEESDRDTYTQVRALDRGLQLVEALGELGWATPGQLAKLTGINRATVYRLLSTLENCGYVHCRLGDGNYFLTHKFKHVADGIKDEDWITQVISPHLGKLLSQIRWPSDFAVFTSGKIVIRESTHRFSPMSINRGMVGKTRPLIKSSLGLAFLSALSDTARDEVLNLAELTDQEQLSIPKNRSDLMRKLRITRTRGYAESVGGTEPKISAIAYPVCWRSYVLGAINIIFFKSAMTPAQAAENYLSHLKECISNVEQELFHIQLGLNTGWLKRNVDGQLSWELEGVKMGVF